MNALFAQATQVDLLKDYGMVGIGIIAVIGCSGFLWQWSSGTFKREDEERTAAKVRETNLAARLQTLEDSYRSEVVTLHRATLDSLNNNTKALDHNTDAVKSLHSQTKENHAATSALLDQLLSERCVRQVSNGKTSDSGIRSKKSLEDTESA